MRGTLVPGCLWHPAPGHCRPCPASWWGPRQSASTTCRAARGRTRKEEPEPAPEPSEPPPPRKGRARKSTSAAGPEAAAAPPPPPPASAAEPAKPAKRARKSSAAAAAAAAEEGGAPAAEPAKPRRSRARSSTAAAPPPAAAPAAAPAASLLDPLAFSGPPSPGEDVFYFEARGKVTASQELDAMEDEGPTRLHLGFSDPLHSMEDQSFHHEQELLPRGSVGAGRGGARVRAPPPPAGASPAAAAAAAAGAAAAAEAEEARQQRDAAGAGAAGKQRRQRSEQEEEGWAKWRAFKAGELPPDEMAYYRGLQEADAQRGGLPEWLQPKNTAELAMLRHNLEFQRRLVRGWEEVSFLEQGFAIHHYQNETGHNRYMNARQLAGYLAQIELEDHENPDPEVMRFNAWSRAEHRFAADYDAFNAHLSDPRNMEAQRIKLAPGAEDAEDVDILDDVLLLSDQAPPAPPGARDAASDAALAPASDGGAVAAEGLDRWLAGVLPGGGADAAARGFADELFADDDAAGDEELEAAI
ncbi:hypothetical protein Rsub_08650 [Raphidocelis subcapitata]|uniref:Uncharacterized protein n=1 Tax=Raphidocelis subcapitata TaxID=307507 RepID=A0A2V0P732_9CHLO|nr:hypothetical protein Rsub_08650 [Raphidocelis subcapitata]|eukprot:GBF95668.1 hypothetical protein Rsub_08650 [Raphidocelis subcapitata]